MFYPVILRMNWGTNFRSSFRNGKYIKIPGDLYFGGGVSTSSLDPLEPFRMMRVGPKKPPFPMTDPWDRYIYLHGWLTFMVDVGKYIIHGSYGFWGGSFKLQETGFIFDNHPSTTWPSLFFG